MTRKNTTTERELPALPATAAQFGSDGKMGLELAGWVSAMAARSSQGDEAAAKVLLQACREVPRLWEALSVLTGHAERAWIDLIAPDKPHNRVARRTIEQDLMRQRKKVAGEASSPLEALLAERVALCWLATEFADAEYARKLKQGMSFKEGEYYARRCEQAQRQLLRAIEALARVRRLLTPPLQLNIADKQINVAS